MSYIMQEEQAYKVKHRDLAEKAIKTSIRASEGNTISIAIAQSADVELLRAHQQHMPEGGHLWKTVERTIARIMAGKRSYDLQVGTIQTTR